MTSVARKIPDTQWESHKAAIRTLYLDQDKTLDETLQVMGDLHAFHATKAQLVRRLRNWGFDKNIKSDDWHRAVRGRELVEAKEIVINGRAINPKRLKKRLGRSDFRTEDGQQLTRTSSLSLSPSSPFASPSPSPSPTTRPRTEPKWDELPDTPLLAAVRYRDLSSVQSLLDFGAAVSLDPYSPHHRPFITAINQGYTLILQSLLAACRQRPESPGDDDNSQSDHHIQGYNALLRRAVNSLNMDSTMCLLDCGAEMSSVRGMPCFGKLDDLRRQKAINMIVMLVEKGADLNGFSEEDGTEPFLSTAIRCEDYAVVSLLLRRGADPARFPSTGMCSPLHLSVKAKNSIFGGEALQALVAHGADVDAHENVSSVQVVPVGDDMSREIEAMLEDLVDRKQRPRTFAFRATPLQAACLFSKEKLVKSLIKAGADVNAAPAVDGGFTAMQIVCLRGFTSLLDTLLEAGADINAAAAATGFGLTALQCAMVGGHRDLAARLLNAGAHVNAPAASELGMTALHIAVHQGDIEIIGMLSEAGATA